MLLRGKSARLLPVFSNLFFFPPTAVTVHKDSGIAGPSDLAGKPNVRPLIADPRAELRAFYHASGGVFPINTTIVVKEATLAGNPGLAAALRTGFDGHAIYDAEEPDDGIHQGLRVGDLRRMGVFPQPHGLETHGTSVRAVAGYLFEQGLTRKRWTPNALFVDA